MTSPSDVLALARAVVGYRYVVDPGYYRCLFCHHSGKDERWPDCPVPIAQRVIEEEGK